MEMNKFFPRLTTPTYITLRLAFYFSSYFILSVSIFRYCSNVTLTQF